MTILLTLTRRRLPWLTLCLLAATMPARAAEDVIARVDRQGERFVADLVARVPAPLADTWAVLTDFERMPGFVSAIKVSTVQRRAPNLLEVAQTTESRVALMTFRVSSLRSYELLPMKEIRSRLISSEDFKSFESITRFAEEPGVTVVAYHGEYVSAKWVPPLIGPSTMASQLRHFYSELIAEVLRRRAEAPRAASAPP